MSIWKGNRKPKSGGTLDSLGNSPNGLGLGKEEFIDQYLNMILENFVNKVVEPYTSESTLFQYGIKSSSYSSILYYTSRVKDVLLDAFTTTTGSAVVEIKENNLPLYLSVKSLSKTAKTINIGGVSFPIERVYTFAPVFKNLEIVKKAIAIVYGNYRNVLTALNNSSSLLLKKSGFNAFFQGALNESLDNFKESAVAQLKSLLNGEVAIVDKEDEIGAFKVETQALKDSIDFARSEIAMMLEVPVNELTGEQYMNTLGSKGAENIDERKAKKRYNWVRESILEPFLKAMDIKFDLIPLDKNELLVTLQDIANIKGSEQNGEIIRKLDRLSLNIIDKLDQN